MCSQKDYHCVFYMYGYWESIPLRKSKTGGAIMKPKYIKYTFLSLMAFYRADRCAVAGKNPISFVGKKKGSYFGDLVHVPDHVVFSSKLLKGTFPKHSDDCSSLKKKTKASKYKQ